MNENLNLCKILKDCPYGTKLYSTVYGNVEFGCIEEDCDYPITIKIPEYDSCVTITSDGRIHKCYDGECILFPSKEQRDWSKFKVNKPKFDPKTLKPFDKVIARDTNDREWLALLFSHNNTKGKVIVAGCAWEQVIPYKEETKHLVGTTEEAPEYYRYWED